MRRTMSVAVGHTGFSQQHMIPVKAQTPAPFSRDTASFLPQRSGSPTAYS